MWSTTQVPFLYQRDLAAALGITGDRVRVLQPPVGGNFGRGLDLYPIDVIAALLARRARRPDREPFDAVSPDLHAEDRALAGAATRVTVEEALRRMAEAEIAGCCASATPRTSRRRRWPVGSGCRRGPPRCDSTAPAAGCACFSTNGDGRRQRGGLEQNMRYWLWIDWPTARTMRECVPSTSSRPTCAVAAAPPA
jgi:hypothetical protein